MKPTSLAEARKRLSDLERSLNAYSYAMSQISFAGETQDPKNAAEDRGEALTCLDTLHHQTLCADSTKELLDSLEGYKDELTDMEKAELFVLKRMYTQSSCIPAEEAGAFALLTCQATEVWHQAKKDNDWDAFAPYLDKIVATMVKFAGYKDSSRHPYDVWLDEFEPGTSRAFYDSFFNQVKATIVPLVHQIAEKGWQPDTDCISGTFDHDRQMELAVRVAEAEGLNMDALVVRESAHPFTDSVSSNNAFVTTHIFEDNVMSNVYSMLHEGGHALYEQGVNPAYNYTCLRGGTSMGMHEAQSRFFENIVGRSEAYSYPLLQLMKEIYPEQFSSVEPHEFYLANNKAIPSLIRTEADELTYTLHIIIRYEIEQALFAGTITAKDVPVLWKKLYKDYLGVDVPDDSQGALQDIHWAGGDLGYFPTYALGSAFGAQFLDAMKREGIEVDDLMADGNLEPIRDWLEERIWKYGRSKDATELMRIACGQDFDASYFCDYLKEKFIGIYQL